MTRKKGFFSVFLKDRRNEIAARFLTGSRILDVGCNHGELRPFLKPEQTYVGIDVRPPAKKIFLQRSGLDDLSDLGLFDGVALIAVIEHIEEPRRLLENVYKSVRKNGRIVITTPTKKGNALHHWLARIGLVSLDAADDHQTIFDVDELAELVESVGFQVEVKKTFLLGGNQLVVGLRK